MSYSQSIPTIKKGKFKLLIQYLMYSLIASAKWNGSLGNWFSKCWPIARGGDKQRIPNYCISIYNAEIAVLIANEVELVNKVNTNKNVKPVLTEYVMFVISL